MNLFESLEQNYRELQKDLMALILGPLGEVFSSLGKVPGHLRQIKGAAKSQDPIILLTQLHDIIKPFINNFGDRQVTFHIEEILKSYNARLEKIISQQEKSIRKVQDQDRFTLLLGDRFFIKAGKTAKSVKYKFNRALNRLRNPAGKQQEYRIYQTIPHWQLLRFIYRNRLQEFLLPAIEDALPVSCRLHAEIREIFEEVRDSYFNLLIGDGLKPEDTSDTGYDVRLKVKDASIRMDDLKQDFHKTLDEFGNRLKEEYGELMTICGTLEFPGSRLWPKRINSAYAGILTEINQVFSGWGRNHWLLFEDWRFDLKLEYMILDMFKSHNQAVASFESKIRKTTADFFSEQGKLGEEFISKLDDRSAELKDLGDHHKVFKYRSSNILIRKISYFQKTGLTKEIENISSNFNNLIGELSETKTFAQSFQSNRLVKSRDILEVKPKQLISVEIAPRLASGLLAVSTEVSSQTERMTGLLIQYNGIIDFGIGSIFNAGTLDEKNKTEWRQTITESFSRASDRAADAEEILKDMDCTCCQGDQGADSLRSLATAEAAG